MKRLIVIGSLACCLVPVNGLTQSSSQLPASRYVYHHPSEDKQSWQWLNLWISGFDHKLSAWTLGIDSSLIFAGRSLGVSRLPVIAEGIDNADLVSKSTWVDDREPGKGIQMLSKATGKERLELMTLLGAYYSFENESYILYKDSVEYFLKKVIAESKTNDEKKLRRVALCLLGKFYALGNDLTNCTIIFDQLVSECRATGDRKTEARAYLYKGMFTPFKAQNHLKSAELRLQDKINFLDTAVKKYRELNNTEGEILSLTYSGTICLLISKIDESYKMFLKVLELERSIDYPYTHYTTNSLATITTIQQKFGEPLRYTLESVNVAEATRDSIGLAEYYVRLGILYYTEGERQEESLKWTLKGLERLVATRTVTVYQTLHNAVAMMLELGREKEALSLALDISKKIPPQDPSQMMYMKIALANSYIAVEDFRLAEQHLKEADSLQKATEIAALLTSYERTMIINTYADLYMAKRDFGKAKKYLEMYFADSTRVAALTNDINTYKQLLQIDSAFNDAPSAVKHYKQYMQLVDSNFRLSKVRQAEELQVLYQTHEKENEIALLNERSKAEQANLKQATLMKNVTIAGIALTLIIAGLLYRQSRLRKKNNQVVTQKNAQLQHLLTEKEWLLKEIHHRVKNNLQIVMSLLNSQSAFIDNEPALTAIHDSQHRVHAMSIIHQKLYGSENVSSIDMSVYIRELASYLADSFNLGQRVRFEYDITSMELDVSQAVPLGLILNEAITNAIKYAFPGERNGIIRISLSSTAPSHYLLTIADNGVGLPAGVMNKKTGSLGMSLMSGLSEDLDGNLSIESNNGTTINISFVHDATVKRHPITTTSIISNN